jgi:hypothetical protein
LLWVHWSCYWYLLYRQMHIITMYDINCNTDLNVSRIQSVFQMASLLEILDQWNETVV